MCDLPPDSTHALLTRSALRRWAEERNLFEQRIEPSEEQLDFLVTFDLGYGERRLRFVIDGVNHLYAKAGTEGFPDREQIDAAKGRLWEAVGTLRDAMAGTGFDEALRARYEACFDPDAMRKFMQRAGFDADAYVREHREQLDNLEVALRAYLKQRMAGFTAGLYVGLLLADRGLEQGAALGPPRSLPRLPVLGRASLPGPGAERRRRARQRRDRPPEPA